jgi:arabinose-5-phosphate isomerase
LVTDDRFFCSLFFGIGMEAVSRPHALSRFEQLRLARDVLRAEGDALLALAGRLPEEFCDAVELLFSCAGSVVVTGMGKAGLIGQKLAATLASTGTNSQYLHPGEAVHGDLGRVQSRDVILALSFSGETEELVRLLPAFRQARTPIVAITGNPRSTLGTAATTTLELGPLREACPLGLAPTTSTTAMLALGDALAIVLSRLRQFSSEDFAKFHPGGNLGRKLARVDEIMRRLADCRMALQTQSVREVLITASKPGRRTGAIMLVDETGGLTGVFTDSDLARLLETRNETALDQPIHSVMTRAPTTVSAGSLMTAAVDLLVQRRISELPVVDDQGKPAGLIDITDVVAWLPSPPHGPTGAVSPGPSLPYTVPFSNRSQP